MNTLAISAPVRLSPARETVLVFTFLFLCIVPSFVKQQLLTGSIVNAVLLVSAVAVRRSHAAVLGVFPSLAAAVSGLLPPTLIPVIPCIAAANALYVFIFGVLYRTNRIAALFAAAFAKFGFLSLCATVLNGTILPDDASRAAVSMLSWPQLFTALAGGSIALAVLRGGREKS